MSITTVLKLVHAICAKKQSFILISVAHVEIDASSQCLSHDRQDE